VENEFTVEVHPVELLLEVLAGTALAGVSETRHLHEIDAFLVCSDKESFSR
jgi:hypothetical protein